MSEYQCPSHKLFMNSVYGKDPDAWLACEHPERMPDEHMYCNEQCENCTIALEAAKRAGFLKNPTREVVYELISTGNHLLSNSALNIRDLFGA